MSFTHNSVLINEEPEEKLEIVIENMIKEKANNTLNLSVYDKNTHLIDLIQLKQLPQDPTYISHEETYVKLWNVNSDKKLDLYSRMIEKNKNCPEYVFMDGPPFVSGNLHHGHIAVSAAKSALHIYKIMSEFLCVVKLGYDCHGLPAVNKTAAENGLDTLEKIKSVGMSNFNSLCEKMIFKYSSSWTPLFQRLARLADFDNVYMTRDINFMETCFWTFKQLWNKGLVYKGNKVMAYSYANQTPLSNFEASQNYHEKETKSIYVKFEVDSKDKEYLVAWTTTPWTLPANLSLCVNDNIEYVRIKVDLDENSYIVGKNCINNLFSKKQKITIIDTMKGSDLVGLKYKPLFPFTQKIDINNRSINNLYKVVSDNYVTEGDSIGTAIVHLAPAFGEDDFRVCFSNGMIDNTNISEYCPLDEAGKYTSVVNSYEGRLVFDCEDDIRTDLKKSGTLLKVQMYTHKYPYCWRTDTPLIYRTTPSWYIKVTALKDRLIELNKTVKWHPREIGENRFHQWLSSVKDWSVSRSTSYATPIPIWISEDETDAICVGSIEELYELTGVKVSNLHPEFLNDLVIKKNNKTYKRISDTFDCWFESGAVPLGQVHYPFSPESKVLESREFLSDFICEGLDQTRGWFYTLLVLSTAIFNTAPYRDVMCTGMILDKEGKKFSKKLGNYVDPQESIDKFGADVIRVYFINSPVLSADNLKYNEDHILKLKKRFTPYINGVKFWIEHTINYTKTNNLQSLVIEEINDLSEFTNLFDKWILLKTDFLTTSVKNHMEKFQLGSAVECLLDFIEDLTNWYIKINRDRLKGLNTDNDWIESIKVLYNVLMIYCRLWAPFTPFLSEHIYQHLRCCSLNKFSKIDSVLLTNYPNTLIKSKDNCDTIKMFKDLQRVCFLVRNMRDETKTHSKLVVPLRSCTIYHDDSEYIKILERNIILVQSELNCNMFSFKKLCDNVTLKVETDKKTIGQIFKKEAQHVLDLIRNQTDDFLQKIYEKKETLYYKSDNYNEILDQRFYKLTRVPSGYCADPSVDCVYPTDHSDGKTNIICKIDNDLMVSIDHTYDVNIHYEYQLKRLHSAIQTCRKEMKVRPWNKITVILDTSYSNENIKNTLYNTLTNVEIILEDFNSVWTNNDFLNKYKLMDGLHETTNHLIYGSTFELEVFGKNPNELNISGRILVVFFKK